MKKNYLAKAAIAITAIMFAFSGCKKDVGHNPTTPKPISIPAAIPDGYTMTMVGLLPNTNITVIEPGYKLSFENGHAFKVHIGSGVRVKDLGEVMPNRINTNAAPNLIAPSGKNRNASIPGFTLGNSGQNANWVTYSEWQSAATNPITNFTTNWTAPNAPATQSGQLFAIWMGLMPTDSTYPSVTGQQLPLIQPALIWGNLGGVIGGGQYWTIVSYMIWTTAGGQTLAAISPAIHNVAPGTALQAQIALTGPQADGSYNCVSQFVGKTSLTITENATVNVNSGGTATAPTLHAFNYACEVLEIPYGSPYITSVSEYPNQLDVNMNAISVTTGTTHPTVSWLTSNGSGLLNGAALGEHTNIINSGEVDMYFQPFGYNSPDVYTVGTPITPLSPTVNVSTPITYSISPIISPYGLSFNTSTGVISGTPTSAILPANFTVTATDGASSASTLVNITINAPPTNIAYDFQVLQQDTNPSYLTLVVNGVNVSGEVETTGYNTTLNINHNISTNSNSTVVLTINQGYMPTTATLHTYLTNVHGVISGNIITFTGVNISAKQPSLQIALD